MVGERETGNETYTLNLIRGLLAQPAVQRGDVELVLYATHPARLREYLGSDIQARVRLIRPANSPLRISVGMPVAAARDRLDLLHVTYVAPPICPCRYVVSVHDISFETHPAFLPPRVRLMLKTLVPMSMRRATRVITLSEHTRKEIITRYGVPADKVTTTSLAAAPHYRPITDGAALADVQARYRVTQRYILALGNIEPRKNLARLVDAYARARERGHLVGVKLVLAGKVQGPDSEVVGRVDKSGYAADVVFPGYIADADLPALYSGARAYVYPSLYEGFGLPPLEAMACGTPVICSNAASLPEVTGDAALSFSPYDTEALTEALIRIDVEPGLGDDLCQKGLRRATQFSWTRCAEQTLTIYREAMQPKR
jgi:glycosyltransferase involved in cell wall biosynthesis